MDADHPYELSVPGGGSLVEIPIQWALDDFDQSLRNIAEHVRGLGLTPRSVQRPDPADF